MPKITINDQVVEVEEGSTIIEAYKKLDKDIAHYCWHPGLSVAGVCRLCMVEVEGNPRMQIACNTTVQDGMVVNNVSDKVKDTVKWGLDFHLINHPLDCPICDQAGECGLQDQYMKFGKYDPEMAERKVKKRKVVDLGERVVLDSERCILCSRCVRFTDEVSKTNELGIFNRGDRSEIGTFEDKPLNNNYSINTVDICPVGALTSKDFRFKQRVWYLKDEKTVCQGCSTGCNVRAYYNEEGLFRIKPEHNPDVNGYWMCDKGRDTYKFVNKKYRLLKAKVGSQDNWQLTEAGAAAKEVGAELSKCSGSEVALVLTGQYTNEEYDAIISTFKNKFKTDNIFHWINNEDKLNDFDDLLFRGDRNPNTNGLKNALKSHSVGKKWSELESSISSFKYVVVAGPENQDPEVFPDLEEKVSILSQAKNIVWLSACKNEAFDGLQNKSWQIPLKTYVEKKGTFTNHSGLDQSFDVVVNVVPGALSLSEVATLFANEELTINPAEFKSNNLLKDNHFTNKRGSL